MSEQRYYYDIKDVKRESGLVSVDIIDRESGDPVCNVWSGASADKVTAALNAAEKRDAERKLKPHELDAIKLADEYLGDASEYQAGTMEKEESATAARREIRAVRKVLKSILAEYAALQTEE